MEDWLQSLAAAGQALLPVVAGALGTAFGGPVGGAVGGALGTAAAGAIGSAAGPQQGKARAGARGKRPRRRAGAGARRPAGSSAAPPAPAIPVSPARDPGATGPSPVAPAGSAAAGAAPAAQLLGLLTRPEVLQAIAALALGAAGAQQVDVGQTPVPPAAIASLLGVLADQSAAQAPSAAGPDHGAPEYLRGAEGAPRVELAFAEDRASALLALFGEAVAAEMDEDGYAEDVEALAWLDPGAWA
jgi:hypothetical protein